MDSGPPDEWGDLLLDAPLPNAELLDDLRLGFGLVDSASPPGLESLDCLGLDLCDGGGAAPSGSDLLESLQLDAVGYDRPESSSGTRHSPCGSGSGSDSPLVLPLVGGGGPAPDAARRGGVPASGHLTGQASPATSESENNGRGHSGSPAVGSAQRGDTSDGVAVGKPNRPLSEEEKRMARMQRNRENAQLSRQRKKQQMADLEERCKALAQQNVQLTGAVQRLTAENAQLRQQLALVCSQAGARAGGATPGSSNSAASHSSKPTGDAGKQAAVAAVAQPASQRAAAAEQQRASPPEGTPAAVRSVLPQWPMLPFGLLPKVALAMQQQQQQQQRRQLQQQQQAARPAGGPSAAAAARPAQQPAQAAMRAVPAAPARPAKRAKTTAAAGASTAFLALFTLFMFAGPFTPGPAPSSPAASSLVGGAAPQRALQALPELPAGAQASDGLHHGGRGLRALPLAASEAEAGALGRQPAPLPPLERGHLHRLLNSTLRELLLEPGNEALEAAALQRLQELGPVALLLDADGGGAAGANPLAASAAFPGLAGQLFGAAGLEAPQVCSKVLEFDAAAVPHAARSRRSLERFVLGATGFRGRSLAAAGDANGDSSGDLPAEREPLRIEPFTGVGEGVEQGGEESSSSGTGSALLPAAPPSSSNSSTLVSVLLPANASGGGALASIDKVFVVVLHPQDRYATYACALPRPVFL